MPKYKAKWAYQGRYSEAEIVDVHEGQVVDLARDVAEWVNRDRPDTLLEFKPEEQEAELPPKRAGKKAQDRQEKGGSNRRAK